MDSESEDQPTRLIRHQKREPPRDLYAPEIWSDCVHSRRGFFRHRNDDFGFFFIKNRDFVVYRGFFHHRNDDCGFSSSKIKILWYIGVARAKVAFRVHETLVWNTPADPADPPDPRDPAEVV